MANVICVWGSPDSGSTTVAIAVAKALARKKNDVALLFSEDVTPTIPTVLPQITKKVGVSEIQSMGKILANASVSSNDILKQMISIPKVKNFVMLGYAYGENEFSYPLPTENDVYTFYQKLADLVEYIVVDCSSNLNNKLTKVALTCADVVIRTCGCSFKSISYFASNLPLVPVNSVSLDKHIIIYPSVREKDNLTEITELFGEADYLIKYSSEIDKMSKDGELLMLDYPASYKKTIKNMIEEMSFIG